MSTRLIAVAGWILGVAFLWTQAPDPPFDVPYSQVLEDRNGRLLAARTASDGHWRFPGTGNPPSRVALAVLTFEDESFWVHPGFSTRALLRAAWQNLSRGRIVSGGSTLTMQVIRLSRGNPPRTLLEKVQEILAAVSLEWRHPKEEILKLYLRHAPMGGNVVGVDAAAWRYFGRAPEDLSWAEAATLAVLPNGPGLIRVDRERERLRAKRDTLLRKLALRGYLDDEDLALALEEPLPDRPHPLPRHARHLLGQGGPGWIRTTIDYAIQVRAEDLVERHLSRLIGDDVKGMAALIVDTRTDRVLAYVGNGPESPDAEMARDVDVLTALRSTGSLLKPFLYALSVDRGVIAPRQFLPDYPIRWGAFAPENFNGQFEGAIPADLALARSRNVPAAWLLREFGLVRFHRQLREWGLRSLTRAAEDYGLPLIIGGAEARAVDLIRLYTALARTALPREGDGHRGLVGLSRGAAWLTLRALALSVRPGEDQAWQRFASGRPIAWKTGTSQGWRDAWSIGITLEYTVLVWAGNPSGYGRPTLQGFSAAAPLMFDLFRILPPTSWFPEPVHDLEAREVNRLSGHLAGPFTPETELDLFPRGAPLPPVDPWSRLIHLDPQGRLADARVVPPHQLTPVRWFVLPPALEWYSRGRIPSYKPLPPRHPGLPPLSGETLAVVYPVDNARLFLPSEGDGQPGKLVIQAAFSGAGELFWHLDGEYLGSTETFHQMEVRPDRGEHTLVLISAAGDLLRHRFTILNRR